MMLPVALDLTRIPVLLIGSGELLQKRRHQLQEAGATQMMVVEFSIPVDEDAIKNAGIVMIAGLDRKTSEQLATQAHSFGKLVNVEDVNDLCVFYFTANVRRGDLMIAVSTSGASPTLARKVRDTIARYFGPEWEEYVSDMGALRRQWKKQGLSMQEIIGKSEEHIAGLEQSVRKKEGA